MMVNRNLTSHVTDNKTDNNDNSQSQSDSIITAAKAGQATGGNETTQHSNSKPSNLETIKLDIIQASILNYNEDYNDIMKYGFRVNTTTHYSHDTHISYDTGKCRTTLCFLKV